MPPVPTAGVPDRVAVPSPLSVKLTPVGKVAPPSDNDGSGKPLVVTEKVPKLPTVKVVLFALVMPGGPSTDTEVLAVWLSTVADAPAGKLPAVPAVIVSEACPFTVVGLGPVA